MSELMISDLEILNISEHYLRMRIANILKIEIPHINSVVIIGSSVNPVTRRKKSDIDLMFLIEDKLVNDPFEFKVGYQTNSLELEQQAIRCSVDVKIYTLSSLERELYHGSLTKVFAILNAFRVIFSKDDWIHKIINDANERLNICVQLTMELLSNTNIPTEISNLENYFNEALSILQSENLINNPVLYHLRLFEYLKEFIIQLQYILYVTDLKNGKDNLDTFQLVKNLIILKNSDGTRLLDFNKYKFDYRVRKLVDQLNALLSNNIVLSPKTSVILFDSINEAFVEYTGHSVLTKRDIYEYCSFINMQE